MTKKQIVQEFLGKLKQRYPRCATTIYGEEDGFAAVTIYAKYRTIQMNIEWDDPKWEGHDAIYIIIKEAVDVVFLKADKNISSILERAEKAFNEVVDGGEKRIGHHQTPKR